MAQNQHNPSRTYRDLSLVCPKIGTSCCWLHQEYLGLFRTVHWQPTRFLESQVLQVTLMSYYNALHLAFFNAAWSAFGPTNIESFIKMTLKTAKIAKRRRETEWFHFECETVRLSVSLVSIIPIPQQHSRMPYNRSLPFPVVARAVMLYSVGQSSVPSTSLSADVLQGRYDNYYRIDFTWDRFGWKRRRGCQSGCMPIRQLIADLPSTTRCWETGAYRRCRQQGSGSLVDVSVSSGL